MSGDRSSVHPLIEALRAERIGQGITQRQVSERTGWSVRTLRALERGENYPSLAFFEDYAQLLGLRVQLARADGSGEVLTGRSAGKRRAACRGCHRVYTVRPGGILRAHNCRGKDEK